MQPAANARPGTTAEAAGAGIAATTIIRELCLDAVPPLAVYFTLRLIGVSHWLALLAAMLVAASRVIWLLVRARALNPYALLMVELFGLDLALSYLPGDARLPLVTGSVIAAALGITWLVMVALGHPPTLEAAKLWDPERAAWRAEQFRAIPEVRHGYRFTSTVWGAAFLTEAIALALLIYVVPKAAMGAVTNAVSIAYLAALNRMGRLVPQRQWIQGAQEEVGPECFPPDQRQRILARVMAAITDPQQLNQRRERSYPRVVKRARHNHYPVKKPGQHGTRHDAPATIKLANPILASAKVRTAA